MERDFLGLNSKEPLPLAAPVKRDISDDETQWPLMKKASSFPHFSSFGGGAGKDDGMNKVVNEPIMSRGFVPRSTADAFNRGKISSMGEAQDFSLSLSNPIIKPNFPSFGQNTIDAITRRQFEGVPKVVTSPPPHVVGFTEPWNHLKPSPCAPQMTILYGGTVSVYEGMSPEKAQAIMLLAGNGSFLASNKNPPIPQIQSPAISASKDEQVVAKTTEISPTSVSKPENQRVPSRGPVPMPAMIPAAVPQFRKASLARFLEKRKDRVASTAPYSCEKTQ